MIYGDMLTFFQEIFRQFDYFYMTPHNVASYKERKNLGKIRGVLQYMSKGELKMENDTLEEVNVPTLWTRQKLNVGYYFVQIEDETFRIVKPADWLFEGGFCCYILETVVGNTDTQVPFEYVNLGQNSYD